MSPQKSNMEVSVSIEIERNVQDDETDEDEPIKQPQKKYTDIYRECHLPEDVFKEEAIKLMEHSTRIPDKIIEIEMRNTWGKYVQPKEEEMDEYESKIQTAVGYFKQWSYQSRARESILAFKCYICSMGWWRLTPFKEHIKQHRDLKVTIEPNHHECCVIAFYGEKGTIREVQIDGLCHYCIRTASEHETMKYKVSYLCEACSCQFPNCAAMFKHEGTCVKFQRMLQQDNILNEYCVCPICKVNCLTRPRYEHHLMLRHSVRSDDPVRNFWPSPRACLKCGLGYFLYNLHICPEKYENALCPHCYRKFQHVWQMEIHFMKNKRTINCSVCYQGIKQCNEAQHMLKHSKQYVMAYKCQRCVTDVWLPDAASAQLHCEIRHNTRCKQTLKGNKHVSIFYLYTHAP